MNQSVNHSIHRLKYRYLLYRFIELTLISMGVALICYSLTKLWSEALIARLIPSVFTGVITFIVLAYAKHLLQLDASDFVRYLNQQYPDLQQSADLLLIADERLSTLEKFQKAKVTERFSKIYPEIKMPQQLIQSAALLVVCVGISFLLSSFLPVIQSTRPSTKVKGTESVTEKKNPSSVGSLEITITPPAYTRLAALESHQFELSLPEGSVAQWKITFRGEVAAASLIFSQRDSAVLQKLEAGFVLKKEIRQSGFYQLKWLDHAGTHWSDFYRIEVLKDEAPKISVLNLNQFTKLKYSDSPEINVTSKLSDDYALSDAHIIATVSKGSGEGVKFREEKLSFERPARIIGKQVTAVTTINIRKLGLEPGDELYFYVQAFDNKVPVANRSRTETFFVALQDTTKNEAVEDEGLGVDLMPDYFRSQRQIIIDTEKLLKNKPRIAKIQFNSTSNELAADQKALRLKYGQFLGEEEDSGIATEAITHDEDEQKAEDITKQFGHQHDKDNEHNLVPEKKPDHHHEQSQDPDKKEDPLAAFVHSHDNSEMATFFEQSLRAKLKAALTVMWDAELYLRLHEPQKSLPYQYTALKLLKEISNDSRIYVHRTGFDPPPLKEEKRLTADLSEIKNSIHKPALAEENDFLEMRKALLLTDNLLLHPDTLTPDMQRVFRQAGQEFTSLVIENPSLLPGLSLLKKISESNVNTRSLQVELSQLRKILWQALPEKIATPSQQFNFTNKMDQILIQELEGSNNE